MSAHCKAFAAQAADQALTATTIERRALGPRDVRIRIEFCGVCHSDLHTARNEWRNTVYPCVPGHEIVGSVIATGDQVRRHAVGDRVGVGCLVDACRHCQSCQEHLEQHCENDATWTYNSPEPQTGGHTLGGYAEQIVVDEDFVLRIPEGLDPATAAPLLCAGITTYSPLRRFNAGPGQRVAVVGLGGLGHVAIKFARALGAEVTLISHSPGKAADAERLGAHHFALSSNKDTMRGLRNHFDLIVDTVSAEHDIDRYLRLVSRSGTLVLVGAPQSPLSFGCFSLINQRRQLAGSLIGGIAETQEMLDFCAQHATSCDIEVIAIAQINEAYQRMLDSDVKFRFVIDMTTL